MKPKKEIKFISPKSTYTPAVVKAVSEARDWLLNWYDNRAKQTNPANGQPYLSEAELAEIHDRLSSIKVVTGESPSVQIVNKAYRGLLKVGDYTTQEFQTELKEQTGVDHEEQIEAILDSIKEDKMLAGAYYPELQASVIALNEEVIKNANLNAGPDSQIRYMGELKQIAIHELTHAVNHDTSLNDPIETLMEQSEHQHPYMDNPDEVHSRLNELRYVHGITPDQVFTPEQVHHLRQESFNQEQRTLQKMQPLQEDTFERLEQIPFDIKNYEPELFKRYNDVEMQQLLNEVADHRDLEHLEEEHLQATPDRGAKLQLPTSPQNKCETAYSHSHSHRHHLG